MFTTSTLFTVAIFLVVFKILHWAITTLHNKPASDKPASKGVTYSGPRYNAHGRVV